MLGDEGPAGAGVRRRSVIDTGHTAWVSSCGRVADDPAVCGRDGVSGLAPVVRLGGVLLPLAGRARVYACGITPYDVTHLGHAATFVWTDALCRVLHACGAEVLMSRNVTDVDDVLLAAASRAGAPYDELAATQQFYFDQDMAALGVGRPAVSRGRTRISGR